MFDVFGLSGLLNVRAGKLELQVYSNEVSEDYSFSFSESVKKNNIGHKVEFYNVDTREFIIKIISTMKVDHICMSDQTQSMNYLDCLSHAFLQKSNITYSPGELPMTYLYGMWMEDPIEEKSKILRNVQHFLMRNMEKNLEGQVFLVEKLFNFGYIHCLQFRLPDEIATREDDIEFYTKKIHL